LQEEAYQDVDRQIPRRGNFRSPGSRAVHRKERLLKIQPVSFFASCPSHPSKMKMCGQTPPRESAARPPSHSIGSLRSARIPALKVAVPFRVCLAWMRLLQTLPSPSICQRTRSEDVPFQIHPQISKGRRQPKHLPTRIRHLGGALPRCLSLLPLFISYQMLQIYSPVPSARRFCTQTPWRIPPYSKAAGPLGTSTKRGRQSPRCRQLDSIQS
jgi:hypothetical protein